MHSTVYEISHDPIPADSRATAGNLPDWFFCSVCDYAVTMAPAEREHSIGCLARHFEGSCSRSGDKLSFSPLLKQKYFRKGHACFKEAAKALAETDYEVFAGIAPTVAFDLALHSISESYEDKRGFYVYCPETEELSTLDHWLRNTDTSKPVYVGGIINYHY